MSKLELISAKVNTRQSKVILLYSDKSKYHIIYKVDAVEVIEMKKGVNYG